MTESEFLSKCAVPRVLASAVIKQCGGWDDFVEMASDVVNHGAGCGFGGWTYHTETNGFAVENRDAIAAFAEDYAEGLGDGGVLEMIQSFNCLGKDYSLSEIGKCLYGTGDDTSILNALAWFCLEETAREYADGEE